METFPWWTDAQKRFAADIEKFVDEHIPEAEESWWKMEFPKELMGKVAAKGIFGVGVPKKYGGLELGATGACVAAEQLGRLYAVGHVFVVSMLAGLHQLLSHGTEEQRQKWLTQTAKGEVLGALCITEPFAGSDAASVMLRARKEGNDYVLNGKKRFITGAGVAGRYFVYARTSDKAEDVKAYRHLTAFVLERGTLGFSLEKINTLIGFDNVPNGVLDFDEVRLPESNRIGKEGQGWEIMTGGLNYERLIGSAVVTGPIMDVLRIVTFYSERRIQFGERTNRLVNNQFKIADIITRLKIARLVSFYTAYMLDLGREPVIESSIAKLINSEYARDVGLDAIQIMGGDGCTKFFQVERLLRDSKIGEIIAGTTEIQKYVIYRMYLMSMKMDLKPKAKLRFHPELKVPVLSTKPSEFSGKPVTEDNVLKVLAENYRSIPGAYMTIDDMKEEFGSRDTATLSNALLKLEEKNLVALFRDKKGTVELGKATYAGLKKAYPLDHYRWYPSWFRSEDIF
ncbi:MAG: acyl-CoA dehydrogenase family protein [Promethearchaeati archaeon SRVP18_Atabeyarchaeia-1]